MTETSRLRQLPLRLPHAPALTRDDFLVGEANRAAYDVATDAGCWPGRVVAIIGPAGTGKSHLAAILAAEHDVAAATAGDPATIDPPGLVAAGLAVVEDADRVAGKHEAEGRLFHLMNLAGEHEVRVLMTGRSPPGEWPVALKDLASRLRAVPSIAIGAPDDALLERLLVKLFADRQIAVEPGLVAYLVRRMERSCAAAAGLVEALDAESMARGRPLSRALAASVLGVEGPGGGDERR